MTEQPEMSVTKTYSLTMVHIAKVADMAQRLNISQGEVMRRAIDAYFAETADMPKPSTVSQTA